MGEKDASDLHLGAGLSPQMRINGSLLTIQDYPPLKPDEVKALVYGLLSAGQIERFEKEHELDFSFSISGISRFRVNLYVQRGSVAASIRRLPFDVPSLEELGLPKMVKEFCASPNGLILVTGPVGSGKSTTLAAMIDYINSYRTAHIITIEDPIEYLHRNNCCRIDQREVGTDTSSFAEALRRVFRQDPDIVLVGEMRDLETIHTVLTLAETGHLILATLHTADTIHAVSRIIDVFPEYQQEQIRLQLALVLVGVISQKLLPKSNSQGRILACEIMKVTPAIANLIRKNQLHQIYSSLQTGKKFGMQTMNHSLSELCKKGLIQPYEASRQSSDVAELEELIHARE